MKIKNTLVTGKDNAASSSANRKIQPFVYEPYSAGINSNNNNMNKMSSIYRMCGKREDTISHVMAECEKFAQMQYKNWRHDRFGRIITWELCRRFGF